MRSLRGSTSSPHLPTPLFETELVSSLQHLRSSSRSSFDEENDDEGDRQRHHHGHHRVDEDDENDDVETASVVGHASSAKTGADIGAAPKLASWTTAGWLMVRFVAWPFFLFLLRIFFLCSCVR